MLALQVGFEGLATSFPPSVTYDIPFDIRHIEVSVREVAMTFLEAIKAILVV